MKAIMISIQPKHTFNILNRIKELEIRTTCPKSELPIDVYIYCTKGKGKAILEGTRVIDNGFKRELHIKENKLLNGKVVAKFTLNKIEKIHSYLEPEQWYMTNDLSGSNLLKKSCLRFCELDDYLLSGDGYAWHIDNLEIFDKPKELSEFYKNGAEEYINNCPKRLKGKCNGVGSGLKTTNCIKKEDCKITKAPQSWCYVEL